MGRKVIVEVLEGRSLLAIMKNGTSDPILKVSLLDIAERPIQGETFSTSQKGSTLCPIWNEKFTFGESYIIEDDSEDLPSLQFSLFHKTQFSMGETPMGEFVILLSSIDITGQKTFDQWVPLEKVGKMKEVSGEIRVRIHFERPQTTKGPSQASGGVAIDDEEFNGEMKFPNELHVSIIQARNLIAMDKSFFSSAGTSDPFVRFKVNGKEYKTNYVKKTLAPVWKQKFVIPEVVDKSTSIKFSCEDHNDFKPVSDFIGLFIVTLDSLQKNESGNLGIKKWYKLMNNKMVADGKDRGEVEVEIEWKYNNQVEAKLLAKQEKKEASTLNKLGKSITSTAEILGVADSTDEEAEELDESEIVQELERPITEEEKKKQEQEKADKLEELSNIEIKEGDYQIQVHIIEARDLKAENADGTSDPIVYVECFGQKRNTSVVKGVTSAVYDELFIFDVKNLTKESFLDGLIRISCYDQTLISNIGGKNTMIGAYAMDSSMVYTMNKDHEFYRQWVPLMDDEDVGDVGVQGYLKISIIILGPGDKLKIHDEEAEIAAELAKEASAGADLSALCVHTPVICREWKYLVAKIIRCEGLPVMDGKIGAGLVTIKSAGTDAFLSLSFSGSPPLKTKIISVKGTSRYQINPHFNTEMWYPVAVPTMTQIIKLGVYDHDATDDELIGYVFLNFAEIRKTLKSSTGMRWFNFYGCHEFKTEKLAGNIKKAISSAQKTISSDINWHEYYNNTPDKATSFKGRVLMQVSIQDSPPPSKRSNEIKPFRLKIKKSLYFKDPEVSEYILKAFILNGNELPSLGSLGSQSLRIRISIGIHELSTKPAKYESGMCRWNELLVSDPLLLPSDPKQLPDIFIYLVDEHLKPICYYRTSPYVIEKGTNNAYLIGFNTRAEWILFQEDKHINALADAVFPGSILMKFGFGSKLESDISDNEWRKSLDQARAVSPYQVRVHLYQGRDLPAADSNGLCDPYVSVRFMGIKEKSKKKKKTLFPVYYETFIFDNCLISDKNCFDFEFAPQICFRLYDVDLQGDSYLGTTTFNLNEAFLTNMHDLPTESNPTLSYELKEPVWKNFFFEKPGDSQGQILVSVELIKIENQAKLPLYKPSIIPKTKSAHLEFLVIGLRSLKPYQYQPIQNSYLDITLNSFGSEYSSKTKSSKRPEPANPNFLEHIIMSVELPLNSIYTSPLCIKVKDVRLGGYSKPTVGVCQIDLSTKLPWDETTYQPPMSSSYSITTEYDSGTSLITGSATLLNQNNDIIAKETRKLEHSRNLETKDDTFFASSSPVPLTTFINERVKADDTGAGIFGALNHINFEGSTRKKTGQKNYFADVDDLKEDEDEQPPAWLVGREKLESDLESELGTTLFETYFLTRGKVNGFFGSKIKTVGKLKGLVRIVENKDDIKNKPLLSPKLLDQLMKPKKYIVRLYALRAFNLAEMDVDIFGNKAKSDPYLKVKLGNQKFDDRQNAVDDVLEVDLYKVIQFEADLPGVSQLDITVMDKDLIGSDDIIGQTIIDLEDRWFDKRWQSWGEENMITPGQDLTDPSKVRWKTKPIERRTLYAPGNKRNGNSRGIIELYLDIMTPEEAITFPCDDVSLPPTRLFEVRVVIWKTKDVPAMDELEGMSDLFVRCWLEGGEISSNESKSAIGSVVSGIGGILSRINPLASTINYQETDTHWRCKRGKASFNWRLKFDVELGHNTKAMKFPYLHLQLWDRDILKWNDCAGEGVINLGKYYKKAYRNNTALKLFEKKKGAALQREKKQKLMAYTGMDRVIDDGEDIVEEEEYDEDIDVIGGVADLDGEFNVNSFNKAQINSLDNKQFNNGTNSDDDDDVVQNPMSRQAPIFNNRDAPDSDDDENDDIESNLVGNPLSLKSKPQKQDDKPYNMIAARPKELKFVKPPPEENVKPQKSFAQRLMFWKKDEIPEDEQGQPLLEKAKTDKEIEANEDRQDALDLVNTIKSMTGLWDVDPEDSAWFHIENRDKNDPSKVTPMGSICYSLQIWPKEKATVMPVGSGRNEPNTNPFLPPPVGRFKFSLNPFVLGTELCGPVLCAKFFCVLMCLAFFALMIFCQPFLNIIINLIFVVY